MNYKYTLENLHKTFLEHGKTAEENLLKDLVNFPDAEHLKCDFNIAMALHFICDELIKLKKLGDEWKEGDS